MTNIFATLGFIALVFINTFLLMVAFYYIESKIGKRK